MDPFNPTRMEMHLVARAMLECDTDENRWFLEAQLERICQKLGVRYFRRYHVMRIFGDDEWVEHQYRPFGGQQRSCFRITGYGRLWVEQAANNPPPEEDDALD